MKALVTGGTGFVGAAVVRRLVAGGHEVRVLARAGSDRRNLAGLAVEVAAGDLRDAGSLAAAVRGCDALFHVAAEYRLWHPRPEVLYAANVGGTENALAAAAEAGVRRAVHTSSVATLGLPADGAPGDEETPVGIDDMVGHYKRSKFEAEEVARRFAREGRLDVVVVNPSTPIGPGDVKPTPTGHMIRDTVAGRVPAYVDTGLNLVHVDDVAAGHVAAFERGRAGERYVLGGENLTLLDVLSRVAALAGRRPPRVRLRPGWVLPLAYVAQGLARVTGGAEPLLTVEGVRLARKRMWFSDAKARRELGWDPRPAGEALRDAVAWFRGEEAVRS